MKYFCVLEHSKINFRIGMTMDNVWVEYYNTRPYTLMNKKISIPKPIPIWSLTFITVRLPYGYLSPYSFTHISIKKN